MLCQATMALEEPLLDQSDKKQLVKQAGAELYQAKLSLSYLPTSWKLANCKLGASYPVAVQA